MLTYYLIVPVLYLFAYLPSSILYKLANVVAFVLRNVIGYRKEVVFTNLRNSFPEKSEEEIQRIAKESYYHLADRVVENIKCVTVSREEVDRRMCAPNIGIIDDYYAKGRHVVVMATHSASWEYGGYKLAVATKPKLYGIVSLVSNPYFNRLIQRTRGKMGMELISMKDAKDFFKTHLTEPSCCIFISDQSPANKQRSYWTTFMHQDTAFFTGAEGFARQHNAVVVFPKIVQVARGQYEATVIVITEDPNSLPQGEITERYVRLLETQLQEYPSDWLWSHKRWKHKR